MSVLTAARTVDPSHRTVPSLRRFARTTPGVVALIAIAAAVFCAVTGAVCAADLNRRIADHDTVLQRSEPFTYAAQNLFAALSEADAAAASAFLSGDIQTPAMRDRYQQAVAAAAAALTDVTAGATDDVRSEVAEISAQLATYTGLVEAARANNLQGHAVGSAYLREASSLMQTELLPGAEKILARALAEVDAGQRSVGAVPANSLVMLSLLLIGVAVGSWILTRRTNRQFNIGLVIAAVVILVAATWIVVATRLAAAGIERSRTEGTARLEKLANARILAQQARTDETLQLIGRGDITAGEESFKAHIDELLDKLEAGPAEAVSGIQKWTASHQRHVQAYLDGDYPAAVAHAIGTDPSASAAQFAVVEARLRDEVEHTRAALREHVSTAGRSLAWSPVGTLVLLSLAGLAAVLGLWPRLKEFL